MLKLYRTGFCLLLFCNILFCHSAIAQDSTAVQYTDISKVMFVRPISSYVSSASISAGTKLEGAYNTLTFKPGTMYKGVIPVNRVNQVLVLKFNVFNSADSSVTICFFPGFYYDRIQLYRLLDNRLSPIRNEMPPIHDSIGFRRFTLSGGDSATIVAELGCIKTYVNSIRPRLINDSQASVFISSLRGDHTSIQLVTYVFCGLLLMMILFSMANFLQGANREFFYYSGYALFLGGMLFTKTLLDLHATRINFFLESYLDFILQGLGIIFYMLFMQKFIDTRRKHPLLHKLYIGGILLLALAMAAYSFLHFFTSNYALQNMVENSTKVLLLLLVLVFLIYSIRKWKDKLLRFLFWGNLLLFIFSLLSQMAVMMQQFFKTLPGIFSSALFYYEMGLFLELVLFLAGLNYKNRRRLISETKERETLKAQNKMQEYEKELAVLKAQQQERERISADMHDELGAGMTAIRLMSEIARNKMKENTPPEIDRISSSANEVLNKMNAIIWSMNSGNDTVDNLVSYIRSYAYEYFENTPISCKVVTPDFIPAKDLSGDKRRNIFLCVKESLNNVLKHSQATSVTVSVSTSNNLVITIHDNGPGIDLQKIRQFGNGLKNITRRMESIGGRFNIENNNGTVTRLELPV